MYNKRGDIMKKIIICPNDEKINLLNNLGNSNELHSNKFMTINEFINNFYFSYTKKTLYFLMNKYHYNIDIL